jgi:phosphatidylglycerophosphate synthase
MNANFLALVFLFLSLLVSVLGLFNVPIPNPLLLAFALLVAAFFTERLSGKVARQPQP